MFVYHNTSPHLFDYHFDHLIFFVNLCQISMCTYFRCQHRTLDVIPYNILDIFPKSDNVHYHLFYNIMIDLSSHRKTVQSYAIKLTFLALINSILSIPFKPTSFTVHKSADD